MTLLRKILTGFALNSPRVATVDDRGQRTFAECLVGAMMFSRLIERTTSQPNVGVMLPTSAGTPLAMLGCWLAGRTMVPVNYLLGRDEMHYCMRHAGLDALLTVQPMLDFVAGNNGGDLAGIAPEGVRIINLADELPKIGKLTSFRLPRSVRDDETAVILYTSGTSGRPKGVPLTFGNFGANLVAGIERGKFTKNDIFLGVLPQFHSFGLTALTLFPQILGAKAVYTARFMPKKIVELMRLHRPSVFMAVPSMYGALLALKDASPADFASLRMCISGGEPLPDAVRRGMKERFNVQLLEGYGLTETTPVVSWSTPEAFRDGCVGKVLANVDIKIVGDEDKVLAPGEQGEILISGPSVFGGYYKDPEASASVFTELNVGGSPRRYFRSGDIGTLSPEGFLAITGRKKEMLIVGGFNVFPRAIEEVLNDHPSVKDSGVVGRSDGLRGEVPVAFVEVKEGERFDESDLRAHCRAKLANYKVPRDIVCVPALPRTPTGKVMRRKLKELLPADTGDTKA